MREGPPIQVLTARLAACPAEFLAPPRLGGSGVVEVAAVVSDLLVDLGGPALDRSVAAWFRPPEASDGDRDFLSCALVASWLLAAPELRADGDAAVAFSVLTADMRALSPVVRARSLVEDPDRREELARWCLRQLGLRPAGETDAQADDRLATLDSGLRAKVLHETASAVRRAEEVREAMRRREAEEAAARAFPE